MLRFTRLCLENYIGIYNGLGIYKLEIDLSLAKHKICVVAGPNGNGKSTILNALNVLPDSNNSFIPNMNAKKEIDARDDESGNSYYFEICSISTNGKRSNEAHVYKNGVDLNPNGNISSYKDTVFAEFNIDANYIAMSHISSEDRGLADKTPAERKKMISSRINSLEVYNGMYKTLNKKANVFKSHLSSISSKLQNLGTKDSLELRLSEISKSEYGLTTSIEDNRRLLVEAETQIKLLDPDGNTMKKYDEYQATVSKAIEDIERFKAYEQKMSDKLTYLLGTSETVDMVESLLDNTKEKKFTESGKKDARLSQLNSMNARLTALKANYEKAMSEDASGDLDTMVKARDIKQEELDRLSSEFVNSSNIFVSLLSKVDSNIISEKDVKRAIQFVNSVKLHKDVEYDKDVAAELVDRVRFHIHFPADKQNVSFARSNVSLMIDTLKNCRIQQERSIASLDAKIVNLEDKLKDIESTINGSIPVKCKLSSTCSLANIFKDKNTEKDVVTTAIEEAREELEDKNKEMLDNVNDIEMLERVLLMLDVMVSILPAFEQSKDIINIFFNGIVDEGLIDFFYLAGAVENIEKFYRAISVLSDVTITYDLNELYNYIVAETRLASSINAINSSLERYISTIENANRIDEEIKAINKDADAVVAEIKDIELKIETYDKLIEKYRSAIELKKKIADITRDMEIAKKAKDDASAEQSVMLKAWSKTDELSKNMKEYSDAIDRYMANLKEISDEKRRIESQIIIWDQFQSEYAEYKEKYDYVNTLRKYVSPTQGGIQSIYMSLYMNKTLDMTNQILSLLFGGQYRILDYIINEDEFRIPFVGAGMVVDDISNGSTSQKSIIGAIISLVTNSSSSSEYGIASLDEIDSGLDHSNRMIFADVISKTADLLGISQLFSVSHSIESSLNNIDVILLSDEREYMDQFANSNIIYVHHKIQI